MATTGHTKADTDRYLYVDDGCSVAPACLACPLPACRYDDPYAYSMWLYRRKDIPILAAIETGAKFAVIAEQFHITERTVFRIKNRNKEVAT